MGDRPYTVLSCCMSLDGYLGTGTAQRLVLSNDDDLDRVDSVRASCDAILVGAATVRNDDPRLLVRSQHRRDQRVRAGLPPSPTKVTVTEQGHLDPGARFFTTGPAQRLVYCGSGAADELRRRLGGSAVVVDAGTCIDMRRLSQDLGRRGVRRLMVEGGGVVLTQFLEAGLADELHLAVAPVLVGDSRARRFVGDGAFPWRDGRRASLAEVRQVGDVVLMRYALSRRFTPEVPGAVATAVSARTIGRAG